MESDVALKSLMISVSDGKSTPMQKNMDVVSGKVQTIKQPLNLLDGMNYIEIVAENVNCGKIGSTRTILVGKDAIADAVSIDRKDYALFFATDKYDNWDDLVNPVEDAHSVADVLSKKYGFLTEIVENPTQDEVGIKIREYTNRKFKPQDQLLIFFAGHGYFDDTFNEGYVVAKNSLKVDPAKKSYISHVRLHSLIDNIPSEHIFLLMDVCFGVPGWKADCVPVVPVLPGFGGETTVGGSLIPVTAGIVASGVVRGAARWAKTIANGPRSSRRSSTTSRTRSS